jgi:aspartate/methionine/tyrosine aminotransferase
LGTAENHLIEEEIVQLFRSRPNQDATHLTYSGATNTLPLLTAVAKLYRDHLGIPDADPSQLLLGSGIAFLVERTGLALCEPDDVVLVPEPCYGAFEPDLVACGAKVVYIDLDHLPPAPPPNAKLLILTNPGNPIGTIIANQAELLAWAYQVPDLHIVTDDVYALSNRAGKPYKSIAGRPDALPDRVHQWYGLSKDWALAGLHVGFMWTRNKELLEIMKAVCGVYAMSSDTQYSLTRLFGDEKLRDGIIAASVERLIYAEKVTIGKLTEAGIPYLPVEDSLFLMIDLTDIAGKSEEQELEVWRELLDKYEVHVLPGLAGFRCAKPGWYRLCFSARASLLVEGLDRLCRGVREMRSKLAE